MLTIWDTVIWLFRTPIPKSPRLIWMNSLDKGLDSPMRTVLQAFARQAVMHYFKAVIIGENSTVS
jgi:hypothetical protein